MSLFVSLLLQTAALIFGIVIVFQIVGKIFIKDYQEDIPEELKEENK